MMKMFGMQRHCYLLVFRARTIVHAWLSGTGYFGLFPLDASLRLRVLPAQELLCDEDTGNDSNP